MIKNCIILLFIFVNSTHAICQERKLKKENVSDSILEQINKDYPSNKKLHFYEEILDEKHFVEAEFIYQAKKYSLLFDQNKLIEIERFCNFQDLDSITKQTINFHLNEQFEKYKIIECQIVNPGKNEYFELEISGKNSVGRGFYEVYFDKDGKLLRETNLLISPIPTQF